MGQVALFFVPLMGNSGLFDASDSEVLQDCGVLAASAAIRKDQTVACEEH